MSGITTSINKFNKNKFLVRFSDFPNLTDISFDTHIFNNYIKTFNIPDISMTMLSSTYLHKRQLHPNTKGSRDLQTITIEFIIDEEMKNWFVMYAWLVETRHGLTSGKKSLIQEELVRLNCVDAIEIISLDNNNNVKSKLKFKHCILSNIGSLQLQYGVSEEATFVCTFEYEEIDIELMCEDD